jgi:hypothetical protein
MRTYTLAKGGWVKFDWEQDVQSVQPHYEDTIVVLKNGIKYLLRGRSYGV